MVDRIEGSAARALHEFLENRKIRGESGEDKDRTASSCSDRGAEVDSELKELIERVKTAETGAGERVDRVREKLARGELLTEEAIRSAARTIAEDGV